MRVLDFGIARPSVIDAETALSSGLTTTTGLLIGTPVHMSPEQRYGESDLDHRADLWSLGIVLYQWSADRGPGRAARDDDQAQLVLPRPASDARPAQA